MALDPAARQYADKLFQQRMEEILKEQATELARVRQDHAARNMTLSGNYFTTQAKVYVRNAELLSQARADSLLQAYEKAGIALNDTAFAEIRTEVAQFCEQQGRNIVQALTNGIGQSFGNQAPSGLREALSGQVVSQISGVSARVTRKLSIIQDERKLAARNAAAGQTTAQTNTGQSTPSHRNGAAAGPLAAPKPIPHAKPHLYYWRFLLEFGQECYRTWRWELLASLVVSFVTYLMTKGDDPLAWRNFKVAFLATAITLAAFAFWHLVRTPWLVHRSVNASAEATIHWSSAVFGIVVLIGLGAGVYLAVGYLIAVPSPPLVKIVAPPPPATLAQAQEIPQKANKTSSVPPSVNASQSPSARSQTPSPTPPQVAQSGAPATFLDRVVQENRSLTPDDRNRLSTELYECDQFIKQSQVVGYKLNQEFGKLNNDRQSGALAKNVDEHIKVLRDLGISAMDQYHGLQRLQEKWQYFPNQTEYVFGDNPYNAGVGLLANATEGMANALTSWSKIANRDQRDILNIEAQQQVDFEKNLRQFFDWANVSLQRIRQMRQSLDPNGVVQPLPTNAVAPAVGMFSLNSSTTP